MKDIANEGTAGEFRTSPMVVWTANAIDSLSQGDWVQLAPYGDWDNKLGMQRFQREDAEAIVSDFKSIGNVGSKVVGLPWYIGHPDHPAFAQRHTDGKAYGRIKELDARDDGLYARVRWSPAGKELVNEQAFHGHSVNWRLARDGAVWRPRSLKSVGFTNEPNIPVVPVTAANEKDTEMLDKMKKLFGMGNDATEDDVMKKATNMCEDNKKMSANMEAMEKEKKAANEDKDKAEKEKESANARVIELEAANKKLSEDVTAANATQESHKATVERLEAGKKEAEANFANERKARVTGLINTGISDGRITGADKEQWEKEFANDFTGTVEKLAAANAKLPTGSQVAGRVDPARGHQQGENRGAVLLNMVNEHMAKTGQSYDDSFNAVCAANPALVNGMQQPEHLRS